MRTAAFLQQQPLFGGVDDQAMSEIMPLLREENFASGELLVREGDQGDSLFVICSGSVYLNPDLRERLQSLMQGEHQVTPRRRITVQQVKVVPQPVGGFVDHVLELD